MIRLAHRVSLGLLAVTGLATAMIYPSLPASVAVHFDMHGRPDSWLPRAGAAVLLPAIAVGLLGLLRLVKAGDNPSMPWIATAKTAFICAVHLFLLKHAADPSFDLVRAAAIAAGALFVGLGMLLPRLRRNSLAGVRTPWTLASHEVWARTQRLTGTLFTLGGLAIAALAWAIPGAALPALLTVTLGISVASVIYSWRISAA